MKRVALSLLLLASFCLPAFCQEHDEEIKQAVQAKVREMFVASQLPGLSVAWCMPDGDADTAVAGFADVENHLAMKDTNRLLAGSTGKTFYSAVALQLVTEGKLELDSPISKWLGSETWFNRLPNAKDITLRMLMNHSSGIPEHVLLPEFTKALKADPDRVWKPAELVSYILDAKPVFPAGKGFSYADTNYVLVGMILEKVTGKTLYQLVRFYFTAPMNLDDIVPSTSRQIIDLAVGYGSADNPFVSKGRTVVDGKFVINPQFEWAGGGFATTPAALAIWAHNLYGTDLIKEPLRSQWLTGIPADTGPNEKYGLGVQIRPYEQGETFGHSGWFPGYLTDVEYFPDIKVAVAVQMNTDELSRLKRSYRSFAIEVAKVIRAKMAEHRGHHQPEGNP